MPNTSGTFILNGLPYNGATVKLWLSSRFGAPPAKGDALPAGSPDYGAVTTGPAHGGDGQYRFTGVTAGNYYASVEGAGATVYFFTPVIDPVAIPEGNIVDGSILARIAAAEIITGAYNFTTLPVLGTLAGYVKGTAGVLSATATIPEADIADGTIFPRLAANETITGQWFISENFLSARRATGTNPVFQAFSAALAVARIEIRASGAITYSDGTNPADLSTVRNSAGTFRLNSANVDNPSGVALQLLPNGPTAGHAWTLRSYNDGHAELVDETAAIIAISWAVGGTTTFPLPVVLNGTLANNGNVTWGNAITVGWSDASMTRPGAGRARLSVPWEVVIASGSSPAFQGFISGEANPRVELRGTGLAAGLGGAAVPDTTFLRTGAAEWSGNGRIVGTDFRATGTTPLRVLSPDGVTERTLMLTRWGVLMPFESATATGGTDITKAVRAAYSTVTDDLPATVDAVYFGGSVTNRLLNSHAKVDTANWTLSTSGWSIARVTDFDPSFNGATTGFEFTAGGSPTSDAYRASNSGGSMNVGDRWTATAVVYAKPGSSAIGKTLTLLIRESPAGTTLAFVSVTLTTTPQRIFCTGTVANASQAEIRVRFDLTSPVAGDTFRATAVFLTGVGAGTFALRQAVPITTGSVVTRGAASYKPTGLSGLIKPDRFWVAAWVRMSNPYTANSAGNSQPIFYWRPSGDSSFAILDFYFGAGGFRMLSSRQGGAATTTTAASTHAEYAEGLVVGYASVPLNLLGASWQGGNFATQALPSNSAMPQATADINVGSIGGREGSSETFESSIFWLAIGSPDDGSVPSNADAAAWNLWGRIPPSPLSFAPNLRCLAVFPMLDTRYVRSQV